MFYFNALLTGNGINPRDVRVMRHQQSSATGLTPYALWRDDRPEFERYQSTQRADRRAYFASRYWAAFVVPPDGRTLFAGVYEIGDHRPTPDGWIDALHRVGQEQLKRQLDLYDYRRLPEFDPYVGCLGVEWGEGKRSWCQRAHKPNGNKRIVELTQTFREPDFPGHTRFIGTLASLPTLPSAWIAALAAARGIYLLTCPKTKEQYVGSAYGADGFWGRWQSYAATGHGGNLGLKSRHPSDYQISILEVLGSAATVEEVIACEALWKTKLQSREMGLNRN